jgi:N-methylhydantoinase B
MKPGDIVIIDAPGGGGYGNPLERDIDIVVNDVKQGYVSLKSAKKDYGVVIDRKTYKVNEKETKKLRNK